MRHDNFNNIDNITAGTSNVKSLALDHPVIFNKKSFNDKVFLSLEMVTFWDISLSVMDDEFYKTICHDQNLISEIEKLRDNSQYDIALLKFLNYLNPQITSTLKNIIDADNKLSNNDSLTSKGKLKYRGGELIPFDVYNNETYSIDGLPEEGDLVYTQNGKSSIILGELIGDGGEGLVYKSSKKNEVIKLIKPDNNGKMRIYTQNRLEQMVKMKINNSNVVWPIETVYNKKKQFIGFSMPYIKGIDLKRFTSSIVANVNDSADEVNINSTNKKDLCKLILSFLDTLIYLHDKNIIIGDIKLENFMVKENDLTNLYFIDCDSYQLGNFPCLLVSPGFVPPEIDAINLGKQNCRFRTFGNENYAIFSLLFHLVFRAKPPYSQQIHDDAFVSETSRVTNGMFPYFLDKERTLKHAPKGMEEPIWAHLPSYIKKAFINVAERNGRNFGEENRLSPRQWKHIFTCYLSDLNGTRLIQNDPMCNQYHYGLRDTIDYDLVDFEIPADVSNKNSLSLEESVTQRFRNNDYIRNMVTYRCINNGDFDYILFNNKLYNNKVLLSLELIKNWNLAVDFVKKDPLGAFSLTPMYYNKIQANKAAGKYELALYNFIRALNPAVYLAYDGLKFDSIEEYVIYLNNYFYFSDKTIIPFDIFEEVINDQNILRELYAVYSKKKVTNSDIDIIINLLSTRNIYAGGVCYNSLGKFLVSVFGNELSINADNLLSTPSIAKMVLKKYNVDSTLYDFSRKEGYYNLTLKMNGCIPFKYNEQLFFSVEDIIDYVRSADVSFEDRFNNIGRWISTGSLKLYSSFFKKVQKINAVEIDVFKIVSDNKLNNWEAGNLFYMANVRNPMFVTSDNIAISNITHLMETLLTINDIEVFTNKLYSNCLFDFWCNLNKKPTDRIVL